ncbi:MAG TPA: nucleotide sugar dehydrogenase [Devosiaceae bacterium]|nr:nucleotide sugar dehydrogenase [Devosiaceae bacterium]
MRISVFGIGYVGAVSSGCLARLGHRVIGVDTSADKVAALRAGRSPIADVALGRIIADAVAAGRLAATSDAAEAVAATDISFISVGTPGTPRGDLSLQAVDQVAAEIGRALRRKTTVHSVVMRSTVPPGTAEERVIPILARESGRPLGEGWQYYSNPEFLREGSSVQDFNAPPFTLIGAAPGDDAAVLSELYGEIAAPIHVLPYRIAESVKYLGNIYHAVKIAFANEAGGVLAAHGVDAREAFRLFYEDRLLNISTAYLSPGFAFGGSCLPKDLRSFLALAEAVELPTPFLAQLLPSNNAIIERALAAVVARGRQRVSLFGLAFKPGTDDLRESPFVTLAERLLARGFEPRIFDRSVTMARLTGSNRAYIDREIPHLEALMVGTPAEALAGSAVTIIGHLGATDLPALTDGLTDQFVLDLAGLPELARRPGISYQGLYGKAWA